LSIGWDWDAGLFDVEEKAGNKRGSFNRRLKMLRFDDLQLFVCTTDSGSLSAAARALDISPAVASAALKRLEKALGARLLVRSTRSLRLTAEGDLFLGHARAALTSLSEGTQLLA